MGSEVYLPQIENIERGSLREEIQAHLDDLTKPPGSLGRLEEIAMQYCLARGSLRPLLTKKKIYTFAGDHGITVEGVSPYPKEVTVQMVLNMAGGGAAISVLCKNAGIDYAVVDIGTAGDYSGVPGVIDLKVNNGTASFLRNSAMTGAECRKALLAGASLAEQGEADIYGIGEMGIGNTSSAAAMYSLLLDMDPYETVGAGTGAEGELLNHKKRIVAEAVSFHRSRWDGSPVDAIGRVGGFEIAGMTGFILSAASKRIPVVVDGFISSVAALAAMKMTSAVEGYLFFSHRSAEHFHAGFLESLGAVPILDLGMRLGEGTGAALAIEIISQAMHCYSEMATFSSAGISDRED